MNPLFLTLIRLRWVQLQRNTRDMNPVLWLAAAVIALALLSRLLEWALVNPGGLYLSAGAGLVLYGIHQARGDLQFMRHLSPRPQWLWVGEYLVFSLPFALMLLLSGNWTATGLWWLFCLAVPFAPAYRSSAWRQLLWGRVIPSELYEWIAGMRKFGIFIVVFYAAALVSAFFLPFAALIFFWFAWAMLAGFYQECEPLQLLLAPEQPARRFLHRKVRSHLTAGWVLGAPVYLAYGVFHPEHGWVVLAFFVLASIQHLFFLLNKYATYRPNRKGGGNGVLHSLAILSVVIPFLVPLPLIMCMWDYGRAVRNLDFYLSTHYPQQ